MIDFVVSPGAKLSCEPAAGAVKSAPALAVPSAVA
jgi:hypothetical protein